LSTTSLPVARKPHDVAATNECSTADLKPFDYADPLIPRDVKLAHLQREANELYNEACSVFDMPRRRIEPAEVYDARYLRPDSPHHWRIFLHFKLAWDEFWADEQLRRQAAKGEAKLLQMDSTSPRERKHPLIEQWLMQVASLARMAKQRALEREPSTEQVNQKKRLLKQ
jgi:hypothetical protein